MIREGFKDSYIGARAKGADTNLRYQIHVVLCSHQGEREFAEYLEQAHVTGGWTGVDSLFGGTIKASVTVIRDDSVVGLKPERQKTRLRLSRDDTSFTECHRMLVTRRMKPSLFVKM